MTTKTRWIFEFNYDADPEFDSGTVKTRLNEELKGLPSSVLSGNQLVSTCLDEALMLKLHFSDNIESIARA